MKILDKIANKNKDMTNVAPATVVFLGDSVTQGCFECYTTGPQSLDTVFDSKSGFVSRFREIVGLLYPRAQVNIINSGISGDTVDGGIKRLDRDVLAYTPDLVVVGYALNDCCAGESNLPNYEAKLSLIVDKILSSGAECILLTPNMMCTAISPHLTGDFLIKIGNDLVKWQSEGVLDKYAQTVRAVATKYSVKVCDVYKTWLAMYSAGVDTTDLLANYLNHPIRDIHYYTAIKLLETIFEI